MTKPVLIKGAMAVDAGGARSADILLSGNAIRAVGDVPAGDYEVITANGRFIAPGLIDCHVHLVNDAGGDVTSPVRRSEAELALLALVNAQKDLEAGVTTMRDTGGYKFVEVAVRDAINRGTVPGPHLFTSGHFLTMTGGHGYFMGREADGVDDLRKAAREQLKARTDWLKIMATGGVAGPGADPNVSQMTVEEVRAVVEEGRKAGKLTAAHAHGAAGIEAAVEGGVASVEHGTYLTEELAERMEHKGTFLIPTAVALRSIVEGGALQNMPVETVRKAEAAVKKHREAVMRAVAKGVLIALGTDVGSPFNEHGQNARELEILVEYGMTPEHVLKAATLNAARLLRVDTRVGLVKPGMGADLLILDRNPLEDISAFRTGLKKVIHGGTVIDL